MARASLQLVNHLREAASKIESGANYNWGNPARCNCGFLAQCITPFSQTEIYSMARENYLDEWTEFANDYCPNSGVSIDSILDQMLDAGLELKDIHQLENLSNTMVLKALPGGFRYLQKGKPLDAALYMRTWAALLELELKDKDSQRRGDTCAARRSPVAAV